MRLLITLPIAGVALLAPMAWSAPSMDAYHVVLSKKALSAGEQVEVRLEPAPPAHTYVYWRNAISPGQVPWSDDARRAVYTAPFVIAPGSPPADIRVDLSGAEVGRVGFHGYVDLTPSSLSLSADCLAPGQSYSMDSGGISTTQDIGRAESVVVHMSDPEFPRVAIRRGMTDNLVVQALVCRTGQVLAAYMGISWDNDGNPIQHDRVFTEAAPMIVQQRMFKPYEENGMPIAGWMTVLVAFKQ